MPVWGILQNLADTRTAIQKFIDGAQSIEMSRADLVATSVSRSGRVITQTRNTVKPWTFKVSPPQIMDYPTYRQEIEELFIKDRHTEHEIQLGSNSGSAWMSEYQGELALAGIGVDYLEDIYITAVSGNTITINVADVPTGTLIFAAGDIIQPAGTGSDGKTYRYPYAVVNNVYKVSGATTATVTINRGFLTQANYSPASATDNQNKIKAGQNCTWKVLVTNLPAIRLLPGRLVEFTGEVELLEVVV